MTAVDHDPGCDGWCSACPVVECDHGSDPATCPVCKGPKPASSTTTVTIEARFTAKWPGQCDPCNLPIQKGQRIVKLSNGRYVHDGSCSEEYR